MTFNTGTGSFTAAVDQANGVVGSQSSFVEYSVKVRVTYTSDWSGNVAYDEFDLTFKSSCWGNTLTQSLTDGGIPKLVYDLDDSAGSVDF